MSSVGADTTKKDIPTIAIVIPVYNGGDSFRRCLASLRQSQSQPEELIVVADGDSDGSWHVAETFGAQVIRLPGNKGPARARNVGAQVARSDILFFIDADITLHPDTISKVRRQFQEFPRLSALIGSYDDEPGARNFLSQYKNLFHHYTHQTSSETASTFWGACGAVRRTAFIAVGGFDEGYRQPCIEDIELGYRLIQQGNSIRLCKEIQVKHLKCWKMRSLLKAEIFYRSLPWTRLLLKIRHFKADLILNHTSRLSVVMVYLLAFSLMASFWQVTWLLLASSLSLGLLILNVRVYRFFINKRGWLFTLQVVPWHWFYFAYGGAAFAYSVIAHCLDQWRQKVLPHTQGIRQSP